jgi:hypothetical protein
MAGELATPVQPVAASLLESSQTDNVAAATMFGPYQIDRKPAMEEWVRCIWPSTPKLGRKVVIKLACGVVANTAAARSRFLLEAQSAASAGSPERCSLGPATREGSRIE